MHLNEPDAVLGNVELRRLCPLRIRAMTSQVDSQTDNNGDNRGCQ